MARLRVRLAWLIAATLGLAAPAAARDTVAPQLPAPMLSGDDDQTATAAIDPLTVDDDDFARARDPGLWRDLRVERLGLREGGMGWRLWRIVNRARASGPLWVVTHDDENATFAAALFAVRSWGGVVMVVDTGARDIGYGARFNRDGDGLQIDPNRNFRATTPLYARSMLRDLGAEPRLIVALHANAPGYDPALPRCPGEPLLRGGSGDMSVALCTARMTPRRSLARGWPFDDDDTLALLPHLATDADRTRGWCSGPLARADFNMVYEHVGYSDGSLSNYAVLRGLDYINFETRDRGNGLAALIDGRSRLLTMIDRAMTLCAPIAGVTLRPGQPPRPAPRRR